MNKGVLQTALCMIFLTILGLYIGKLLYPENFIFILENPRLIAIGNYIDTHRWAYYFASFGFCFATYWLFVCAACRKKYLVKKELRIATIVIIISYLLSEIAPSMSSYIDIVCMLLLCVGFKATIKDYAFVFSVDIFASILLILTRGVFVYVASTNFMLGAMAALESYLWLIALYLIQNYFKKESLEWEKFALRFLGQIKDFMRKKFIKPKTK